MKYILLAITILVFNTLILNGLVYIGLNKVIAKILTEIVLFSISYLIQKKIVFIGGDQVNEKNICYDSSHNDVFGCLVTKRRDDQRTSRQTGFFNH